MKVKNMSHKLVASLLGLGSVMVFAGVVSDMRLHSDNFMDSLKIESATETGRINTTRFVASSNERELPAVQYLPYNNMNQDLINGKWEIRRIVDANSEVIFDRIGHYEDRDKSIKVDFDLVGTSTVMIDQDSSQVYKISLLTEFGTIALFKVMGDGYEILEAKKIVEKVEVEQVQEVEKVEEAAKITGLRLDGNKDLVLERALHPSRTSQLLSGESVRGNVSLIDGNIENLSIALYYEKGQREEYEIAFAEINDGGMFEAMIHDETVHGIITNNGEGVFRIRFATGKLQGAMLNFVTQDKLNEIVEDEYVRDVEAEVTEEPANYYSNSEVYDQSQAHQVQLDFENARKEMSQTDAQDYQDNTDSAFLTEEDQNKHTEAVGFEF